MAPALPGGSSGLDLGGAIQRVLAEFTGVGQVFLGTALVGVALLLLLGETQAGGTLARGARAGVRRAARAIPGVGALA